MELDTVPPELVILYGTQTGNAQEVAEDLAREASKRRFRVRLQNVGAFDVTTLPHTSLVIFVVSTCGQGEVPTDMKEFWKFLLRRNLPNTSLQSVRYAVFGLGDSAYAKYNYVSKMLFNRLKQLGGKELLRRGDGNDQHPFGLYGDLGPWSGLLWESLHALYPGYGLLNEEELNARPPPRFNLCLEKLEADSNSMAVEEKLKKSTSSEHSQQQALDAPENWKPHEYSERHPFMGTLTSNARITAHDWEQDVRHIVIDITGSGLSFEPGDIVYVKPSNPASQVMKFLDFFGWDGSQILYDINPNPQSPLASTVGESPLSRFGNSTLPITLFDLFRDHLDFLGTPPRYFFELLSYFTPDQRDADQLRLMASAQGYENFYEYCRKAKRNYFDVLVDFPSAKPPLTYILDLIKPIKARPFSISSSQKLHPNEIHISLAVVQYISSIRRKRYGLCSNFLANLDTTNVAGISDYQPPKVRLWLSKGSIKFPQPLPPSSSSTGATEKPAVPVIMVGPGTGCAIFRSFLHQSAWHALEQHRLSVDYPIRETGLESLNILTGNMNNPLNSDDSATNIDATALSTSQLSNSSLSRAYFFFGCRHRSQDYLYAAEWAALLRAGVLSGLFLAFSRDPRNDQSSNNGNSTANDAKTAAPSKHYVQHEMALHGELLWRLIDEERAIFIVSGRADKMPKDVRNALLKIACDHGKMSFDAAEKYVAQMEQQNRYLAEVW